jgi:hypothetical protein
MDWARGARAGGYSFKAVTGGVARLKNVDALINSVHSNHGRLVVLPSVLTVNCPHPPDSDVICFVGPPVAKSVARSEYYDSRKPGD